jgi:N-acetyl-gamma-glutamyl-phosphate reductase
MNTYSSAVRVGVVGATGFAGQELIGLLARHPQVRLEVAMSSSVDSAARPLPRLKRIWDGPVEALDTRRLANDLDLAFLAVPEHAAADLAPGLVSGLSRATYVAWGLRRYSLYCRSTRQFYF